MSRTTKQLQDSQIQRAKIKASEYNLADGNSLQLRVKPSGKKVWLLNYTKPVIKKRTNMKLGDYPQLSLAAARLSRDNFLKQLALGNDPQEYQRQKDAEQSEAYANTLQAVAERWFEEKSQEITKGYAEDLYNSLVNHVFPKLGDVPIHKIRIKHVKEVLKPVREQGKLELIKRICQRLNMIMDYAVVIEELIDINPLIHVHKAFKAPGKTHLPTIKPDQLPSLMKAIQEASVRAVTRLLMEWQLHTMVRPSEAAGARWKEIDFNEKVWNVPANRMKKRRDHSVPLTAQTLAILEVIKPISGQRKYIFPSDIDPQKHANSATVNMALRRMGYKGKLVSHGFRSLASTTLNEKAFDPDLIESALAHEEKNTTRAAYNRTVYLERRRPLMQWWSDHIDEATTGSVPSKGKKHLKVVNG